MIKPGADRSKQLSLMLAHWAMFAYNDVAQFSSVKGELLSLYGASVCGTEGGGGNRRG